MSARCLSATSVLVAATIVMAQGVAQTPTPFAAIVDGYLDRFAAYHPSIAAGNGLHGHDGELEDFSAPADRGRSEMAAGDAGGRSALSTSHGSRRTSGWTTASCRASSMAGCWIWTPSGPGRRNPMIYATAISDGVHNLMTMESSAASARMPQVVAKLRARAGAAGGSAHQHPAAAARLRRARGDHVPRRRGPPESGSRSRVCRGARIRRCRRRCAARRTPRASRWSSTRPSWRRPR